MKVVISGLMLRSIALPEKAQAKTYLIAFILGLIIAFSIWGLSYIGWTRFGIPSGSFLVKRISSEEAMTLETLLENYQLIQPQEKAFSTTVKVDIVVDFWDKAKYPKDLLIFHVRLNNEDKNSLWYPTILILIMDSRDYVRGKTLLAFWSENNGIESEQTDDYLFHFQVPDDMKGDNVFIKAFSYGELKGDYPDHSSVRDVLDTTEDNVYGQLPNDFNRFLTANQEKFRTYPDSINYVFQSVSILGTLVSLFIFTLSFMVVLGERLKNFLGTEKGFVAIMVVLMIALLSVVFLISLHFY